MFNNVLSDVTINGICCESIYRPDIHLMIVYQCSIILLDTKEADS